MPTEKVQKRKKSQLKGVKNKKRKKQDEVGKKDEV